MKSCRGLLLFILALSTGRLAAADEYVDPAVGFSFVKLPGWSLKARAPVLGGPGTCVELTGPESPGRESVTICGKPDVSDPFKIDATLQSGLAHYLVATGKRWNTDLSIRPGSVQFGDVAGRKTLSATLDYNRGNRAGVSYIVWVQSGATRLSLIGETDPTNLEAMIERLRPILDSIRLP